ncbi:MAG: hypothetical protein ABR976_14970 [Terracidiphilus sp.]
MAHLWNRGEDGWGAQRLDGADFDLGGLQSRQEPKSEPRAANANVALLIKADAAGLQAWALIASPDSGVRVNSRVVPAGLCVLADRDEIRVGNDIHFFSTETLAAVEEFPEAKRAAFCGRCRQQIESGSLAVCCPTCGVWYNQSADLPCWTYSEKCTFCGHPTALDSGFAWTPEED